jgi:hypothetical protein
MNPGLDCSSVAVELEKTTSAHSKWLFDLESLSNEMANRYLRSDALHPMTAKG